MMTDQGEKKVRKLLAELGPLLLVIENDISSVRKFLDSRCASDRGIVGEQREKLLSYQLCKIFTEILYSLSCFRSHKIPEVDRLQLKTGEDFIAYMMEKHRRYDASLEYPETLDFFLVHMLDPLQQLEDLLPLIKERIDENESLELEIKWDMMLSNIKEACFIVAKIKALKSERRMKDL